LARLGLDGPGIATSLLEAARRYGLAGPAGGADEEFSTGGSELHSRLSGGTPVVARASAMLARRQR
ncbi:MAG: hypothetical protein ACLQFX_17865, partial [Acidimicrobiales bacterium]